MASSRRVLALLVPVFLVAACGAPMRAPIANAGPALSQPGVEVAVVRQGCAQIQEPDDYGWDLVDETIQIEVRNSAVEPATVHRDQFHLLVPDGTALRTVTWRASDPLVVAGGQTQAFALRFMTRGGLACTKEMRLDPGSGITLRASPIAFQPVAFVPTRGL